LSDYAKTHHHQSCAHMMQLRTKRHNAVLDVVLQLAKTAGHTFITTTTNFLVTQPPVLWCVTFSSKIQAF
jgi:hypothetical protein